MLLSVLPVELLGGMLGGMPVEMLVMIVARSCRPPSAVSTDECGTGAAPIAISSILSGSDDQGLAGPYVAGEWCRADHVFTIAAGQRPRKS
jgi:hypothetical protein